MGDLPRRNGRGRCGDAHYLTPALRRGGRGCGEGGGVNTEQVGDMACEALGGGPVRAAYLGVIGGVGRSGGGADTRYTAIMTPRHWQIPSLFHWGGAHREGGHGTGSQSQPPIAPYLHTTFSAASSTERRFGSRSPVITMPIARRLCRRIRLRRATAAAAAASAPLLTQSDTVPTRQKLPTAESSD